MKDEITIPREHYKELLRDRLVLKMATLSFVTLSIEDKTSDPHSLEVEISKLEEALKE